MLTTLPTAADYRRAFDEARALEYPNVDAFELRMGHALDARQTDDAARVLACPVKTNPPHWQHGRVIYAAARAYLQGLIDNARVLAGGEKVVPTPVTLLDIGTAKGFSALCLLWALLESDVDGRVHSVDVIDPKARERRNTVAEVDGFLTLAETLRPWPVTSSITFEQSTGIDWLNAHAGRVHVAFVDGKHTGEAVRQEGKLLAKRQEPGDLAMFDDCQIPGVSVAVVSLEEFYKIEYLKAGPREYAIGRRR